MNDNNSLLISEQFYSIQGENTTTGVPAVFLRMTGCNLTCSGWSYVNKAGVKLGCDTTEVWRKGEWQPFDKVYDLWMHNGWIDALQDNAHLILTGGEPLLHQLPLSKFLRWLKSERGVSFTYIEVETNGTIQPEREFDDFVNQYNVSPKLSSGGDPLHKRYVHEVLEFFAGERRALFKFVICDQNDVAETFASYINKFHIPTWRVAFMPEGATHEELKQRSKWLIEICKQYRIRYSPRLHIHIYDQATGV